MMNNRVSIISPALTLTPALSQGERGKRIQSFEVSEDARFADTLATILPLPLGEGRGEGFWERETCA